MKKKKKIEKLKKKRKNKVEVHNIFEEPGNGRCKTQRDLLEAYIKPLKPVK